MRHLKRKTAPAVRDGRTLRKNRWDESPSYLYDPMPALIVDRRRPGRGYRHLVRKEEIRRFLPLLPDWDTLQQGLNAVVLDAGGTDAMGWHMPGVIALCAWEKEIVWECCTTSFLTAHIEIFHKLNIPVENSSRGAVRVLFRPETAKAFQLVHVLVHELGHHFDRMTTRSRQRAARGEPFAEEYARRHEDLIIERYFAEFQ